MLSAINAPRMLMSEGEVQNEPGLFSSESVLDILRLILAGAPLRSLPAQAKQSAGPPRCGWRAISPLWYLLRGTKTNCRKRRPV